MLEQNPFLEAEEEAAPAFEPLAERLTSAEHAGERETERAAESGGDGGGDDVPAIDGAADFGGTEREDWETAPSARTSTASARPRQDPHPERRRRSTSPIATRRSPACRTTCAASFEHAPQRCRCAAVLVLIDSLDDEGYLADSLEDIAARLREGGHGARARRTPRRGRRRPADPILTQLRCGLRFLQSMEPTGVGARDLAEMPDAAAAHPAARRGAGDRDHRLQEPPAAARPPRPEEAHGRDRRRREPAARGAGADRLARAQARPAVRPRRGEHRRPRRDRAEVRAAAGR
jgi:DNA-directed RNA polymerase specialized sigma54-like protein